MSTMKERLQAAVTAAEKFGDEVDARGGIPTGEDQKRLLELLSDVKDAKKALEADADAKGTLADAKAFMSQLAGNAPDQSSAKAGVGSIVHPTAAQVKTFGQAFVESDAYGAFVKQFARGGVIPDSIKGIQSNAYNADLKALITGVSNTSAGAIINNDVYSQIVDLVGARELTMRDVVTKSTTQSDTVEFVRVTGKTNNAAAVAEATSSAAPTTGASSGAALTLNAGGGYKPESGLALERVSTSVKTLAHWIPITKRAAADAGQVRTMVDVFLREGLDDLLDSQMLAGNGSGENLLGILNSSPLTVGSAGTDIDAIVDAVRTVRVTGRRRADTLVIHPNDWYSTGFLMAKDSAGKYLIGDPGQSLDALKTLWGLKVVISDAITENTALVGDFRYAVLWEREGVNVMVSDQHADFFIRNLLAILAEMRVAFGVLDPEAFCTVTAV